MICLDVFEIVASLIGEDASDSGTALLKKRVPALISTAALELFELDRAYRVYVNGEEPYDSCDAYTVHSLDDIVPVCTRLVPALCFYVADLAVRDENADLAELLATDYAKSCDSAARALPAIVGRITDKYSGI